MNITQAREIVGRRVELCWIDRKGSRTCERLAVLEVHFAPMYGTVLSTTKGDVALDHVESCLIEDEPGRRAS